ncbi:MAG: glycosyltransferase family protein [Bacteroidota bacterium]
MKILYAIQGTGNGHVSRAKHLIPYLQAFGELDLLISGTQVEIELPFPVSYRLKGFSFAYNAKGGVALGKSAKDKFSGKLLREIWQLPVQEYDLVINDFEPISAWAARLRRVPCIALGHQASFLSPLTPRPEKRERFGEWVLRAYAPAPKAVGYHFERYEPFIFPPIIRGDIRNATPKNEGHFTVYLPAFSESRLFGILQQFATIQWQVFSKKATRAYQQDNVWVRPVNAANFTESLVNSQGVLTGAGFETPAEALFLGKKLMTIPIRKQYEQACNGAALARMGVPVAKRLDENGLAKLQELIEAPQPERLWFPDVTQSSLEKVFDIYERTWYSNSGEESPDWQLA